MHQNLSHRVTVSPLSNPALPSPAFGPCFLRSACCCLVSLSGVRSVPLGLEGEGDWVGMFLALSESLSCLPHPKCWHWRSHVMWTTLCPEAVTELGAEVVSSVWVTSPASHRSLQIYFRLCSLWPGVLKVRLCFLRQQ